MRGWGHWEGLGWVGGCWEGAGRVRVGGHCTGTAQGAPAPRGMHKMLKMHHEGFNNDDDDDDVFLSLKKVTQK